LEQNYFAKRAADRRPTILLDEGMARRALLPLPQPCRRTGTSQRELTWSLPQSEATGTVNFEHWPGPLNSVMELLSSYTVNVSVAQRSSGPITPLDRAVC
jgi:hypothetical protein